MGSNQEDLTRLVGDWKTRSYVAVTLLDLKWNQEHIIEKFLGYDRIIDFSARKKKGCAVIIPRNKECKEELKIVVLF